MVDQITGEGLSKARRLYHEKGFTRHRPGQVLRGGPGGRRTLPVDANLDSREGSGMGQPHRKHWTWDDYVKMPDDGKRYEILDGELVMVPSPGWDHQDALLELALHLTG